MARCATSASESANHQRRRGGYEMKRYGSVNAESRCSDVCRSSFLMARVASIRRYAGTGASRRLHAYSML